MLDKAPEVTMWYTAATLFAVPKSSLLWTLPKLE